MSSDSPVPDYDLDEVRTISSPQEVKAAFHALRGTLLDLLSERAATVAELAVATKRPNGTIAYHVDVLRDAGLVTVVRTRKVRAIDQRYYGRTARVFVVGAIEPEQAADVTNCLSTAAAESSPALAADQLRAFLRHVRISERQADEFWPRVFDLVQQFSQLPREGEQSYGLVVGLYPTDHPALPDPHDESS
jgi:DNA-binding transcriptional ArsR family regulator